MGEKCQKERKQKEKLKELKNQLDDRSNLLKKKDINYFNVIIIPQQKLKGCYGILSGLFILKNKRIVTKNERSNFNLLNTTCSQNRGNISNRRNYKAMII